MERGGFHGYRKLSPNTTSAPKFFISDAGMRLPEFNQSNSNTALSVANNASRDEECTVREQDRFMPIANVIRIMRRILPPHAKISDDAKETIQECVSEYISFITGEANERCQREQRKTITAEDVLWAMSKLGFDEYIEPLTVYLHRCRELEGERGSGCAGGGSHMISMSSGLVMKGANGMVADYGAYGVGAVGLHLAHYHHQNSHRMNHQNRFAFGGYDANPNFKDSGTKTGVSCSAAPATGAGAEVSQYEQHKY